jgi:hypothetical protein
MFDCETLAKARVAAARLDDQLQKLHLEEQRCQLQRQRLETEISCVRTIIDLCEPAQRLADQCTTAPAALLAAAAIPNSTGPDTAAPHKRSKPDGLPSIAKMITTALEEAAADGHDGLRPCDMAEFVRTTWWRDVQTKVVNTTA